MDIFHAIFFHQFPFQCRQMTLIKKVYSTNEQKQIIRHFACSALTIVLWTWYASYENVLPAKAFHSFITKQHFNSMKKPVSKWQCLCQIVHLITYITSVFLTLKDRCLSDIFYHLYAEYVKWWILICISMET